MRMLDLFVLLVSLAATPGGRADVPESGANGIITADELKTVAFKSRVLKADSRTDRLMALPA